MLMPRYPSIDGFSDRLNASVRSAEHEKFSCHFQASVQSLMLSKD